MRTDVATSASLEEVNYIVKLTKRLCKLKKKKSGEGKVLRWGGPSSVCVQRLRFSKIQRRAFASAMMCRTISKHGGLPGTQAARVRRTKTVSME